MTEKANLRSAFGRGLVRAGETNKNVVALVADLTNSVGFSEFAEKFPERFVNVGVAEQNLVTVASGMARVERIPFAGAYAAFSPGRNWEQIRTTICINNLPVKIVSSHAGVNVGPDGATHQALEDIALMRVLPNMVVLAPGDAVEAEQVALAMARDARPNYVRLPRSESPVVFDSTHKFQIGPAYKLRDGTDVVIFTTGTMTAQGLAAAGILAGRKIDCEVVHIPTIKPLDAKTILKSAKKCRCVVTVEEHQVAGGFGSSIAELLGEKLPVPIHRIGIYNEYGQSGAPDELLNYYGLTAEHIAKQIRKFLK
ncbi:MAG: transketolase family protein [Candidatus Nomurabacteria bacterium]|jgi:transketolase|nr:transketolase family protein [Candidatus Nomurabacteria bacterium]